ncbi:MAG: hypothetical protein BWZ07_02053 [Alphaproteobacteria bacterium ADurb.BinA280]|nr:MAG: hypothetical protein BWZ07_02053 [Alphaproteobacteria bacterium ADurb.BinA280]
MLLAGSVHEPVDTPADGAPRVATQLDTTTAPLRACTVTVPVGSAPLTDTATSTA